jgi:DNA-binding CsgD family transcriptional regulator
LTPTEIERVVERFCDKHALSVRENQTLLCFTRGLCRKETADILGCRIGTIDTYWRRIFVKVGVDSSERLMAALLSDIWTGAPDRVE